MLYNRARDMKLTREAKRYDVREVAFEEVVLLRGCDVAAVFKLAHLVNLYNIKLKLFGTDTGIHPSRLKNQVLEYFPNMEVIGKHVKFLNNQDAGKKKKKRAT